MIDFATSLATGNETHCLLTVCVSLSVSNFSSLSLITSFLGLGLFEIFLEFKLEDLFFSTCFFLFVVSFLFFFFTVLLRRFLTSKIITMDNNQFK